MSECVDKRVGEETAASISLSTYMSGPTATKGSWRETSSVQAEKACAAADPGGKGTFTRATRTRSHEPVPWSRQKATVPRGRLRSRR